MVRSWATFSTAVFVGISDIPTLTAALAHQGVMAAVSRLDQSLDEFKEFVMNKFGVQTWQPIRAEIAEARLAAADFMSWLYDKGHDEVRGGRPLMLAARGIAPYMPYYVNRSSGQTEYYDEKLGVWCDSGGELFIAGDTLSRSLEVPHFTATQHRAHTRNIEM